MDKCPTIFLQEYLCCIHRKLHGTLSICDLLKVLLEHVCFVFPLSATNENVFQFLPFRVGIFKNIMEFYLQTIVFRCIYGLDFLNKAKSISRIFNVLIQMFDFSVNDSSL